ncbi:MAG: HAD family hydrolase [Nitrospiria bacterium]
MPHIELLIFDLDGTLIDSKKDIARSVNLTFRDVGLPEKPYEVIYGYVGNGVRQLMTDAVEANDPALIDEVLACFEQHYLSHLLDETRLFPGIAEVLSHFEHKKIALVTNKPTHYTDKIIEGLQLSETFDLIIGAGPDIQLKPHPDMLLKTLDTLQTDAQKTVMIGDSLNDIHAAKAAGTISCSVGYGFGCAEELQSADPDFSINSSQELMTLFS